MAWSARVIRLFKNGPDGGPLGGLLGALLWWRTLATAALVLGGFLAVRLVSDWQGPDVGLLIGYFLGIYLGTVIVRIGPSLSE